MLQFSRSNFFTKQNLLNSNDLQNVVKNNLINQRIKTNFEINEISSLTNLRENSILFLDKHIQFAKSKLNNLIIITSDEKEFNNKEFQNIILVKKLNDAFIEIINYLFSHEDSLNYSDEFEYINNSFISKSATIDSSSNIFNNCVI